MMAKRTKASLDLVLPVAPYYRTDPQVLKDVEAMRTRAASRWAKDDQFNTALIFPSTNNYQTNDHPSTMAVFARSKIEMLRANSPTLKRLLAVRAKLEKYINSMTRITSASRQSTNLLRETPFQSITEKQPATAPVTIVPPPVSQPSKQTLSQSNLGKGPLDKITYEKLWTRNGNMRQKCSLEIWLPKADSNEDDETISRASSPTIDAGLKVPLSPKPSALAIRSRRSSVTKIATTTMLNTEFKLADEIVAKKIEPILVPRVYHYEDYLTDLPDERPRSSKSVTVKSDAGGSVKSAFRQRTRPQTRRPSASTTHSDDALQSGTTATTIPGPATAKILKPNSAGAAPASKAPPTTIHHNNNNATMISDLMRKYSLMKKSHQELTQAKLQLEKPHHDTKNNGNSPRVRSPPRAPLVADPVLITSYDRPTISVKKLLVDTPPPPRPVTEHSTTNAKLSDRRGHPPKPSYSDINAQSRVQNLPMNQHRGSSASVPVALLPSVRSKKNDEIIRTLQRSKTLDVIFDAPDDPVAVNPVVKSTPQVPVRPDSPIVGSNTSPRVVNETVSVEQKVSRTIKRSTQTPLLSLRPDHPHQSVTPIVQLLQYHNVQKTAQQYHHPNHHSSSSTTNSPKNNKVLVHLKYSNGGNPDRNCLVPD